MNRYNIVLQFKYYKWYGVLYAKDDFQLTQLMLEKFDSPYRIITISLDNQGGK